MSISVWKIHNILGFLTCCPDKSVNKTPLIRLSMWEQGKLLMLICSFSVSGLWSYNRFSSFWLIWKTCSRSHLVYIYGSCNPSAYPEFSIYHAIIKISIQNSESHSFTISIFSQNFTADCKNITQWKISTEKKTML